MNNLPILDNQEIYKKITLISQLLEIHAANEFKIKSYTNAAFTIKKCGLDLKNYSLPQLKEIKGIGNSIAENIFELIQTNEIHLLNELMQKTPIGIVEMLKIKGIGPKKINIIWKDLEIETIGELLYACNENKLMLFKGFGQKTQENIQNGIILYLNSLGNFLYATVFEFAIS
ncbi:MAG: helix-hairpin-helix domain-containing protein, partial [Sediminibacterium sp.]|nr:helix-hairpin-helix domain-containing protein [Sediminibacterium sp.]